MPSCPSCYPPKTRNEGHSLLAKIDRPRNQKSKCDDGEKQLDGWEEKKGGCEDEERSGLKYLEMRTKEGQSPNLCLKTRN